MYKYYYRILFIFILSMISLSLLGQNNSILDSLYQRFEQEHTDSVRVMLLTDIVDNLKYTDRDKAFTYAYQALQLAQDIQFEEGEGLAKVKLGQINIIEGNIAKSLEYYQQSLGIFIALKNPKLISDSRYYVATAYESQGNYQDALKLHFDNLKDAELLKDSLSMARSYFDIGENYRYQQDGVSAEKYFQKAKIFNEALNRRRGSYRSDYHLALAKDLQGEIAYSLRIIASLFKYSDIFNANDSANIYNDLGRGLIDLEMYDSAEVTLLKALELREKTDEPFRKSKTLNELATLYLRKGEYDKSITYGKRALEVVKGIGDIGVLRDITDKLNKAYYKKGDYKKAYEFQDKYYSYIDSIYNIDKARAIMGIQAEYEVGKKEQENLLLKKQAELDKQAIQKQYAITITVVIILLLVSILAFIAYRAYTLRKQAALKIEELNATQSRWFTNIAHELRTPLTLILGPLKNVLSSPKLSTKDAKELEIAHKNGQQLLKLVNQILDISKMEIGQLSLDTKPINLSTLVRQSTAFFSSYAAFKHIELTTAIEHTIYILADDEKIKNILINLISNALNFTHNKGSVTVSVNYDEPNGLISVTIKDTGDGISPDDLPNIFDRFYQAKNKGSLHQGGSGIGLALSMEFAKLHGGNISANSILGKGSEFMLKLPMSLQCEEPKEEEELLIDDKLTASTPLSIRSSEKPNLLLVEDNPDMQEYISNSLKNEYHIVQAVDGVDALEKLKNYTPDLIISDVMMPRMDGLAFANKIKESSKFKIIPFITLTARADEEAKLEVLRIGIDDYVVKPFNLEELKTRANNLLVNYKERKLAIEESKSRVDEDTNLSYDEQLVQKLTDKVNEHIDDNSFSVKELANYASMSESTLHRSLKKVTGLTPGQFIREIKLQKALRLFELRTYKTISEVVYAVGFDNKTHFAKLFKNRFGKAPSEYLS